jgi:5-formyltetrahydrofolate cyclo-ligase
MRPQGAEGQPHGAGPSHAKARLRAQLSAARAAREPDSAAETARAVRSLAACAGASAVAAYAARPGEPSTQQLIDTLLAADVPVLLPVVGPVPDWAWYTGPDHLVPGRRGILQPDGPSLGAAALAVVGFIWLPGLAGTPDGRRLGTGGGWYDRALAWAGPDATRGLLLFDDEVLEDVPTQEWDQPVDLLVTERRRIDCGNTWDAIPG